MDEDEEGAAIGEAVEAAAAVATAAVASAPFPFDVLLVGRCPVVPS